MSMTADRIGRLELLQRLARRKGWAVCLRTTADHRFGATGARLVALDVVEPGAGESRRRQLVAGDLIARVAIGGPVEVELAAATIIEMLQRQGLFDDLEAA